jgi:hypothetical protein
VGERRVRCLLRGVSPADRSGLADGSGVLTVHGVSSPAARCFGPCGKESISTANARKWMSGPLVHCSVRLAVVRVCNYWRFRGFVAGLRSPFRGWFSRCMGSPRAKCPRAGVLEIFRGRDRGGGGLADVGHSEPVERELS